jgi:excisionase family DNA binding protein
LTISEIETIISLKHVRGSRMIGGNMEEKKSTLSVKEACDMLGISRGSLYQGIHSGEIPSFRVGRRYVIPRAPVERILDATTSYIQKEGKINP